MPRLPFRVIMFLSSYAPLFAILSYTNRHVTGAWISLGALALLAPVGLAIVLFTKRDERGPRLTVAHAKPQDGEVMAYVASYLIPFLGSDLSTSDGVVVLVGFLIVLSVIYVSSSMLFVNPLLTAAGFHTFEVEDSDGHAYTLLTRRVDVDPDSVIRPAQITRYLRVEIRHDS